MSYLSSQKWYNKIRNLNTNEETMLHIQEIRKNPDGLAFEQGFDLTQELQMRNPEILNVQDIFASGRVQYEDGLYF